jgi:hypothetical protein
MTQMLFLMVLIFRFVDFISEFLKVSFKIRLAFKYLNFSQRC